MRVKSVKIMSCKCWGNKSKPANQPTDQTNKQTEPAEIIFSTAPPQPKKKKKLPSTKNLKQKHFFGKIKIIILTVSKGNH